MSQIQKEQWLELLIPKLFPATSFINYFKKYPVDPNARLCHVPREFTLPTAFLDSNTPPTTTATYLSQMDTQFPMRMLRTDATKIDTGNEVELPYSVRESVVSLHRKVLLRQILDYLLYRTVDSVTRQQSADYKGQTDPAPVTTALPAGNFVPTTGTGTNYTGLTGTRKRMTLTDWTNLKELFDNNDVPQENRFIIIPAKMQKDLALLPELTSRDFVDKSVLPSGVYGSYMGFNIILHSSVPYWDNAGALAALNLATKFNATGTDRMGCIAFHSDAFAWAYGGVDFIAAPNPKEYTNYECVATARMGGGRVIDEGIAVILQAL